MNVYISNFQCDLKIDRGFELDYKLFLKNINEISDITYLSDTFTDYLQIEKDIKNSDFMIAFIDQYWTSSTWKMIEYSMAKGIGFTEKIAGFNVPIFVSFSKSFKEKERFLKDSNVIELPENIEEAIKLIKEKLL